MENNIFIILTPPYDLLKMNCECIHTYIYTYIYTHTYLHTYMDFISTIDTHFGGYERTIEKNMLIISHCVVYQMLRTTYQIKLKCCLDF